MGQRKVLTQCDNNSKILGLQVYVEGLLRGVEMLPLFVSEAHGYTIQGQSPGTGGLSSMAQGHPFTCFTKDQQGWKLEKWEMDRGHRRGRTLVTPSLGAQDPHPLSPGAEAALGGEVKGGTGG